MIANMRRFLLALVILAFAPAHAADEERGWSPVQNGLQARLLASPETSGDWSYGITIEFRNVKEDNLGIGSEITLSFNRADLNFSVIDSAGKELPMTTRDGDGMIPNWNLILPPGARLSFPIGSGGSIPYKLSNPHGPGKLLSFGLGAEWIVPGTGGPYQLSVVFSVPPFTGNPATHSGFKIIMAKPSVDAHPEASYRGWRGTLHMPALVLPQN